MTPDKIKPKIRVLVADDALFMRTALRRMIESEEQFQVVGTANDGLETLEKIDSLKPDVLTLDLQMPRLNGVETLKRIMQTTALPVIIVSSMTQEGAETTFECLSIGAFDYIPKQLSSSVMEIVSIRDSLVEKIKAAAEAGPRSKTAKPSSTPTVLAATGGPRASPPRTVAPITTSGKVPAIIAIGTSTGGPKALQEILPTLPADLAVGVVIVQHMPPGFTAPFARRLDSMCNLEVREATANETVEPGSVLIAPAGWHLTVQRRVGSKAAVRLSKEPAGTLHMPSVDVTMLSVASEFRELTMGIILTGMGDDGARGMKAIHQAGGLTIGQDEASCAVYGMPRSCAEQGSLDRVVPLLRVPEEILAATGYGRNASQEPVPTSKSVAR